MEYMLGIVLAYELTSEHSPLASAKFHLCWHQTSQGFRVNDGEDQNVEGIPLPFPSRLIKKASKVGIKAYYTQPTNLENKLQCRREENLFLVIVSETKVQNAVSAVAKPLTPFLQLPPGVSRVPGKIWIMVMTILIILSHLQMLLPGETRYDREGVNILCKNISCFRAAALSSLFLCVEVISKGYNPFDICWQPEMNCWWCLRLFLEVLNTRVMCFLQALSLRHIARYTKGRSAA